MKEGQGRSRAGVREAGGELGSTLSHIQEGCENAPKLKAVNNQKDPAGRPR